ncbi:Inositol-pentakisphosphate 2-kinase [Ancistrocladus abbreviatus]
MPPLPLPYTCLCSKSYLSSNSLRKLFVQCRRLMELILEEKDASDWTYRGEGAANLVLAYVGSSPAFVGKVIRLQKVPRNGANYENGHTVLSKHERLLWKDAGTMITSPTMEIAEQLYVQYVMIPLLGSDYVDAGKRVLVSREFLETAERNVLCQRPSWRVNAAKINTCIDSVLLMADHSVFPYGTLNGEPCISVEIKPKCGFLPSSRFIAEENGIKKNVTRFKMHQVLKLHHHQISQLSEYDPLDLFSRSRDGINKAIKALFATPQNNLRVFLNGSLIYGGLGGGTNGTSFIKGEEFEDYIRCFIQGEDGLRTESFMDLVAETISRLGMLDRLLEVQKLDYFDIEGAIHAYYNIISQPCMVCINFGEDEQQCRYLSLHSIPFEESVKIVKDYLIAATAKDCSLMISFRPREDKDADSSYSSVYLESTNQGFEFKAYFIDLDLKPLKKMEHYYELDRKIVNCYTHFAENMWNCENCKC